MLFKTAAVTIALFQIAELAQAATSTKKAVASTSKASDYWKNFNSTVDPLKISVPKITQTTSYDEATECTYYQPTNFAFNAKEWPNMWETATSNGMNTSAEFKAVYNSLDWANAPNITVRKLDANGALDMTGYDTASDPDCWWSASTCTIPKHDNVNADIYTCPEPETWGLTYDDGPNCSHNAFYDYLEQQKLKASMFYIGSNVVNWPYGAQRGLQDGHHLADHTWSHQLMTTLSNQEVLAELYYTQKAIKMVTGVTPLHWRPAFGDVDDRVRWIASQLGMTTILWDLDTDDWAAGYNEPLTTVQKTYEDFIQMGSNGTYQNKGQIVLTHEINNTTMTLAVDNLPKIMAAYKNVIDVATCMNITQPYHETTVTRAAFDGSKTASTSGAASGSASASGSSASSAASGIAAGAASTSAGIQLSPNALVLAAAAIAAYVF